MANTEITLDGMKAVLEEMGVKAVKAAETLANTSAEKKNAWLKAMAKGLEDNVSAIVEANKLDMAQAEKNGLSIPMLDRLMLDEKRVKAIADALVHVTTLEDPVGKKLSVLNRPNGLRIEKVSVPIGVIGIIYESRPNVTVDAAGLCMKAGNVVILRGGSEALNSNKALMKTIVSAAMKEGMPEGAVQLIPWTDHAAVGLMLKMDKYVDLIIPRGGERLIRTVVEQSTIPVLKHYKGVCHVYVDKEGDFGKALDVIENAKCQRPGVCNAIETVLIDKAVADEFIPAFAERMRAKKVEMRGDEIVCKLVPDAVRATEDDWYAEYLNLIIAVKTVSGVVEAVDHVNKYGSGHSEAIISNDEKAVEYFLNHVDSAAVYANASTRFTDGGEFGMGAEIGISTDKLHARGPMGLVELTSYKYKIYGTGQCR